MMPHWLTSRLSAHLALIVFSSLVCQPLIFAEQPATAEQALEVEQLPDGTGYQIKLGDQIIAGYLANSNDKPVIYPLVTPSGKQVVRDYPIKSADSLERDDHPHHRSLWLTHGEVNDTDFWADPGNEKDGSIRPTSTRVSTAPDGGSAIISTTNDWLDAGGQRLLSDARRFTFRVDDLGRLILDCDFRLTASDGEVHFGDTKEGSFGMRVAGSMKADAKLGGVITNAEGFTNKNAWGVQSPWVDYSGPVLEEKPADASEPDANSFAGVTMHYHPSSHNAPCRWHVRDYGLFAANPFGVFHFVGGEKTDGFRLQKGESIDLHFRVVIHDGPLNVDQTQADWEAYANSKPANVVTNN